MHQFASFVLVLVLSLLTAAGAGTAQAAPFKVNSGKTLEVLAIKPEKTDAGPSLVLHYATQLSLTNLQGLRREADELWEHFSDNANAAKVTRAVIRATDPKDREKAVDFVFVKRDGIWHTLEKGLVNGKLTERFIRDAHDRGQWIDKHKNYTALMMYVGHEWTVTYTYPPEMQIGRQTLDRKMMLVVLEQTRRKITQRQTKAEITDIRISPDGKSATVSNRISGEVEINGQIVNMSGRGQDFVVVRDGTVVSIRSIINFQKFSIAIEQ